MMPHSRSLSFSCTFCYTQPDDPGPCSCLHAPCLHDRNSTITELQKRIAALESLIRASNLQTSTGASGNQTMVYCRIDKKTGTYLFIRQNEVAKEIAYTTTKEAANAVQRLLGEEVRWWNPEGDCK